MSTAFKKLPGVMSLQRLTVVSDALFYNLNEDGSQTPLRVIRHGIRGTQNLTGKTPKDVSNIQVTESAKTGADAVGVSVKFALSFLPLEKALFSCAGEGSHEIKEALDRFIDNAKPSDGLREVANRYARNVFNGRWLWRNRLLGTGITVKAILADGKELQQDALKTPLNDFNNYSKEELELGELIYNCLAGYEYQPIQIEARIDLGFKGVVEVFPSQNYVNDKPKGFARPLYKVDYTSPAKYKSGVDDFEDIRDVGHAALRDQKVGNALRTLDTWFPDFKSYGKPIPVEPLGANLEAQRFFRDKKDTSFKIMCAINTLEPDSDDGKFLIASLIRGGVYSESDKGAE